VPEKKTSLKESLRAAADAGFRLSAKVRAASSRTTARNRRPATGLQDKKLKKPRRPSVVLKMHWKWRVAFLLLLAGAIVATVYGTWACFYDMADLKVMPQRTWVYDYKGEAFTRLSGENRVTVPIDKVSPLFVEALLAREDTRFYKHYGVDPIGIARAVVRNIIHRRAREGASTLTQQLARNSFPLGGRTLHRKLLEAAVSIRIENHYSKKEILESYVNRIYFGSGCWGVETASRTYFGKPSANLTLSEAAILAGLIRSPQRFSPLRNLEGSLKQRDTVLERMTKLGMITLQQQADAKNEEVALASTPPPSAEQGYVLDLVEQELSLLLDDDQLVIGGLKVYTSIDADLQKTAEEALERHLAKVEQLPGFKHPKRSQFQPGGKSGTPYLQGAVMVIDNATGGIRAVVGGRDFAESRFNRALLSSRQVGSTFKPFVYAAAYAAGAVKPDSPISDGKIARGELRSIRNWSPGNSDGVFGGTMRAEEGLIQSRNTMSVRVGDRAGLENVRKLGGSAGFVALPKMPAIFLGAFESTLKGVTSAYTIFPNGGVRRHPFVINRVVDGKGNVLYKAPHPSTRVVDPRVARMVSGGLHQVMRRGTGAGSTFKGTAGGKTGTTNDYRDAWFVGYTSALTCGVWVGLDKPQPIMQKGYGATLALPIWSDVMTAAHASKSGSKDGTTTSKPERPPKKEGFPKKVLRSFRHFFEGKE